MALLHLKLREQTDDATKPRSKKQTKSMPYARVPRTQVKARGASALSTSAPKFGSLAGAELVLPSGSCAHPDEKLEALAREASAPIDALPHPQPPPDGLG